MFRLDFCFVLGSIWGRFGTHFGSQNRPKKTEIIDNFLSGLSMIDRYKLARSMGYCPQMRCQLTGITVDNTNRQGQCPMGLCYSRMANGAMTFGGCCFVNGTFNAGELIGYYDEISIEKRSIITPNASYQTPFF